MPVRLHFHGAAGAVTGSCFRLQTSRSTVLIDCGMFQGSKRLKELNYRPFPFDAAKVDAVLLTHAHIDHSGLLPKLMRAGFSGPIHATAGTRELAAVMLPDAGGIQEHEVAQLNRRFQRRGRPPVDPIYTSADADACMGLFSKVRYDEWVEIAPDIRARWWDAGHILGSASIEMEVQSGKGGPMRLLFSGDLGQGGSDFSGDPTGPAGIDHLIMETTYGGRERPLLDAGHRRAKLADEVRAAHEAGGPLVMPAFAVERTQQLITDLVELMEDGTLPRAQIFLDSPLAIRASQVFYRHARDANGANPFAGMRASSLLHPTESPDESRALERVRGWHIIVAASGMCDAGRVRHHLKRLLWRDEATVLLTGFQAAGTLGRILQEGTRRVSIQGEDIRVRARIRSLDVYSAHADGPHLLGWAQARRPVAGKVFLVHGEPDNRQAMADRLVIGGFERARIEQPEIDDCFMLSAGSSEKAPGRRPRIPAGLASLPDWHNARAKLLLGLNEVLEAAPDDATREELIDSLLNRLAEPPSTHARTAHSS